MPKEPRPIQPVKPKSVTIDAQLHRYLKLLSARDGIGLNDMVEPPMWNLVGANREWLERSTGEPLSV